MAGVGVCVGRYEAEQAGAMPTEGGEAAQAVAHSAAVKQEKERLLRLAAARLAARRHQEAS